MGKVSFTDANSEMTTGFSRKDVLVKLRASEGPLSVIQLAERTGLHVNTTRFHLDRLVIEGLATRSVDVPATRGRPRILYHCRDGAGPRSFGLLAQLLTALVASLKGTSKAILDVGRLWGGNLVNEISYEPSEKTDVALVRLNALLEAIGFEPEITRGSPQGVDILLHHCPFLEIAEVQADVVCQLHLGLMQGALSQLGADLEVLTLTPFVQPTLCTASLRRVQASNEIQITNPNLKEQV